MFTLQVESVNPKHAESALAVYMCCCKPKQAVQKQTSQLQVLALIQHVV